MIYICEKGEYDEGKGGRLEWESRVGVGSLREGTSLGFFRVKLIGFRVD